MLWSLHGTSQGWIAVGRRPPVRREPEYRGPFHDVFWFAGLDISEGLVGPPFFEIPARTTYLIGRGYFIGPLFGGESRYAVSSAGRTYSASRSEYELEVRNDRGALIVRMSVDVPKIPVGESDLADFIALEKSRLGAPRA